MYIHVHTLYIHANMITCKYMVYVYIHVGLPLFPLFFWLGEEVAAGAAAAAGPGAGVAVPSSFAPSMMSALAAATTSCVEPPPLSSGDLSSSTITTWRVKNLGLRQPLAPGIDLMSS